MDLKAMQNWPLERNIMVAQTRIMEWYIRFDGACFISYSGGLDSSVLLDLARRCYPDIEAVYVSTLDLPEIKKHVHATENVTFLQPKMTFAEAVKEYGFCYPSKDVALTIYYARRGSQWAINRLNGVRDDNGEPSKYRQDRYGKWKFLAESQYKVSDRCCKVMKEQPLAEYERITGKHSIIGTRADESKRRKDAWLQTGCNAFDSKRPVSKPLSLFTHQDILEYIKRYNIPYASCYGEIVPNGKGGLMTTGEKRTGCLCAVGCHLDKVNRFHRLKESYPKLYDYIIDSLGLGEFLDFVGVDYGKEGES